MVALLFIDLDNFKLVNDSLGHQMGDRLLVEISERLKGCLQESDTAARQGGDEFAVLLEDVADAKEAVGVAERFESESRALLDVRGQRLFTTASIDIAVGAGEKPEGLMRAADLAMYQAKSRGKAHRVVLEPDTRG
jgi:diguanylate cyclase (GGDEF)-like protein